MEFLFGAIVFILILWFADGDPLDDISRFIERLRASKVKQLKATEKLRIKELDKITDAELMYLVRKRFPAPLDLEAEDELTYWKELAEKQDQKLKELEG